MKTVLLSALSLLIAPSAFAIPFSFSVSTEEVGEDFSATLEKAVQTANDRCAERNGDFVFSCSLREERSFEIRTLFKGVETQPTYRNVYETTVKGQFTCLCQMSW